MELTQEIKEVRGQTQRVTLPSGKTIILREQNGEDEEKLSQASPDPIATSLHIFLLGIIVMDDDLGRKPELSELLQWGIRDIYYALFKSRLFSLGSSIKFEHDCNGPRCNHHQQWEEDLNIFDRDLSQPIPENEEGKSEFAITPYPLGKTKTIEIEIDSRVFAYDILDAHGEHYFVELTDNKRNSNSTFLSRSLRERINGEWQTIYNFRTFSSRMLAKLRASIVENDKPFVLATKVTCPKCNFKEYKNLFEDPNFFVPAN